MRVRQHPARQGSSSGANTDMQASATTAGKSGATLSKKAVDAKGATSLEPPSRSSDPYEKKLADNSSN